jgi:hypothetical protein
LRRPKHSIIEVVEPEEEEEEEEEEEVVCYVLVCTRLEYLFIISSLICTEHTVEARIFLRPQRLGQRYSSVVILGCVIRLPWRK